MYLPAFCRPLFGSPGIFLVWGHCPGTSVHCHLCSLPLFWEYLRGLRSLSWCGWAERRKRTRGRTDMWQLIRSNPCQWSQPFHSFNVLHCWPCFHPGKQSSKSDFPFQWFFNINFLSRLCFVKLKLLLLAIEVEEMTLITSSHAHTFKKQ